MGSNHESNIVRIQHDAAPHSPIYERLVLWRMLAVRFYLRSELRAPSMGPECCGLCIPIIDSTSPYKPIQGPTIHQFRPHGSDPGNE